MPDDPETLAQALADAADLHRAATERVQTLEQQLEEARREATAAAAAVDAAYAEAHAEEIAEQRAIAEANHERHQAESDAQRKQIDERRRDRLAELGDDHVIDHTQIAVFSVDGHGHAVVAAHGLMLGTHGLAGGAARDGTRYRSGCGLTVDAPHDELDHERFDQSVVVDCPDCLAANAPVSEYLSSKEQIALARAAVKARS